MDTIIAGNLLLVCSICLDSIANHEERSIAKLKCGHEFHLDCIGSAFNVKGAMMCPNCRNIEDGTWLYANGSSLSDVSIDDRAFDENLNENLSAEYPSGLNPWCPFCVMEAVHSSFEQIESPPTPMNLQHQSWGHHSPSITANGNHLNGVDHTSCPSLRATRVDANATSRSGPSALPFRYNDISFTRGRSLFISSLDHHGDITHPHERIQVSHVGHPSQGYPASPISPVMPAVRRFSGPRGMSVLTQAPPQGGFSSFPHPRVQNLHEENRDHLSRFPDMLYYRDRVWDSHQQASGGSDSSGSVGNFWRQWP